jgi:hypothetical protein
MDIHGPASHVLAQIGSARRLVVLSGLFDLAANEPPTNGEAGALMRVRRTPASKLRLLLLAIKLIQLLFQRS